MVTFFIIRSLLKSVMYVSRLESLGHTSSVQQFSSMDKCALVEGLWRSQRHNPKALCLITDICYDYNVRLSLHSLFTTWLVTWLCLVCTDHLCGVGDMVTTFTTHSLHLPTFCFTYAEV